MATFRHFRNGMTHAWDTIAEGWRHLSRRAASAITRFIPHRSRDEGVSGDNQQLTARSTGWGVLAAEVFDDDSQVVVRLEVPGMERDDFDLEVIDDLLIVRGEKRVSQQHREGSFHVLECAYGRFERTIPLPAEVDAGKASARYRRGVLQIELPKTAAQRRRHVDVTAG